MAAAIETFTLDDFISLFNYEGPKTPKIYSSELISFASQAPLSA